MPPFSGLIRRIPGMARTVPKVVDGVKTVKKASVLTRASSFVRNLPVVRIFAGTAVGVMLIDAWSKARSYLSETLGMSEDASSMVLGCGIAIALAVAVVSVVSLVASVRRRRMRSIIGDVIRDDPCLRGGR